MANDMEHGHGGNPPTAWERLAPVIDLATPMAMRAAATLRIADILVDGPLPVDGLARRAGVELEALTRLMRLLTAHGVFMEARPGTFGLNSLAELLRADHPSGMRTQLDLDAFGGRMDLAFTGIMHTLRSGQPAFESIFGATFWEYLSANPAMSEGFDAMMASAPEYVDDVVSGYDWPDLGHIIDVGGGTGALLAAILETNPGARGTVVDLPDTARRAGDHLASRGLGDRCDVVGQSFFDPLPTFSDATDVTYVLSNVQHDWPDGDAVAILRRCRDAAVAGDGHGRVVIVEGPGSADDPAKEDSAREGDSGFAEMNLRMLVFVGGRQRRVGEYATLAEAAGLTVTGTTTTSLDQVVIDCRPIATA
ncbi:MAG: hypothetical protein L0H59_02420 [Tomitella sp.]|nr:hypothetical protein [Tomitella sp.]